MTLATVIIDAFKITSIFTKRGDSKMPVTTSKNVFSETEELRGAL